MVVMRSTTMIRLIDAALVVAPVCTFACGGDVTLGRDASVLDATSREDADADDASFDATSDSSLVVDGSVGDAGCVREVILDNGCQDLNRGWWIHTTCGDQCGSTTLCADYYKQCPCSPGYQLCNPADADVFRCFCGISGGRYTAGIDQRSLESDSLGDVFAWMAWGESASVHAFEVLERELAAHGAPRRLLASTRRARRDEVRHARIGRRLALRHGVIAEVAPAPDRAPARTLEAIAIENAVEACVRETWSAVLARAQIARARDPIVRRVFARIADDEARHATLAWNVAAWAKTKLPRDANRRVETRMRTALAELRDGIAEPGQAQREAGIPSRAEQLAMMDVLERTIWSI